MPLAVSCCYTIFVQKIYTELILKNPKTVAAYKIRPENSPTVTAQINNSLRNFTCIVYLTNIPVQTLGVRNCYPKDFVRSAPKSAVFSRDFVRFAPKSAVFFVRSAPRSAIFPGIGGCPACKLRWLARSSKNGNSCDCATLLCCAEAAVFASSARQWDKRRERRSWEKGGWAPVNQVARKKTLEK